MNITSNLCNLLRVRRILYYNIICSINYLNNCFLIKILLKKKIILFITYLLFDDTKNYKDLSSYNTCLG